jgi:signal transduction histidine kinase
VEPDRGREANLQHDGAQRLPEGGAVVSRADDEHAETIADIQRRLEQRPRLSLRLRIAVVFAVCAVVVTGITAGSLVMLSRIQAKLHFLEAADECALEMQEARRYEKNFFLYGTSLSDALDHAYRADRLLVANWDDVVDVIGESKAGSWLANLREYETLLEAFAYNAAYGLGSEAERQSAEMEVRRFGGAILDDASAMIAKERQSMNAMIRTAMVAAAAFLGFMVLLLVLLADQLARQVIRPIGRFIRYVERIAQGDLSPIRPARRYRDEFSTLAIAINRMLDEIKVRQEQLVQSRKMAAVGTLTSGIAHELNNPLNNISLTAETLLEDFDTLEDARKRRLLGDIFTQVQRASATVRNLLDFTRKDAPVHATVAIGEIIDTTVQLVGNELALASVRVRIAIPPDLPAVDGNPRSLQQVFLNLFLNAMQAMPDGGDLTVDAHQQGDEIRIAVSDTGIGIPEEFHEKVFEPFFTTKEAGEGTGLGLSVSYSIVRQHGGRIEVRSEVGRGATFVVVLPVKPAGSESRKERA